MRRRRGEGEGSEGQAELPACGERGEDGVELFVPTPKILPTVNHSLPHFHLSRSCKCHVCRIILPMTFATSPTRRVRTSLLVKKLEFIYLDVDLALEDHGLEQKSEADTIDREGFVSVLVTLVRGSTF